GQNPDGSFFQKGEVSEMLPLEYRGQHAQVVDVELSRILPQGAPLGAKNAFGETIGEQQIANPMLDVVVRFGDGRTAMVDGFPAGLAGFDIELVSVREARAREMEEKLPALVGRTVYAV